MLSKVLSITHDDESLMMEPKDCLGGATIFTFNLLMKCRLMERVSTEGWREAGAAFVGCVTRLLERLLDYRAVMQGAEHRDKRMAATVNLLVMFTEF